MTLDRDCADFVELTSQQYWYARIGNAVDRRLPRLRGADAAVGDVAQIGLFCASPTDRAEEIVPAQIGGYLFSKYQKVGDGL
jgi:hypothetical protein